MWIECDAPGSRVRGRAAPALRLLTAACTLLLSAAGVGAGSPGAVATGRIEGSVTLGPRITGNRMRFSLYPAAGAPQRPAAQAPVDEFANVVVYIESIPEGAAAGHTAPPRMEQRRLSFEPHVLPVVRGTTVEFPNRDTVFHNVFSLSKVASFDLGRYPNGASKTVRFDETGLVKVFCHIHSDMSAVILVLDNPFFTTPDPEGRFALDGIPPGDYRLAAWHERARLSVKRARVEAGRAAVIDFDIPLAVMPEGG